MFQSFLLIYFFALLFSPSAGNQPKTPHIINPVLIRFYPHKRGWPDLPHSASNLSHSHSIPLDSLYPPSSNQHSYSPPSPHNEDKIQQLKEIEVFHENYFILKIFLRQTYNPIILLISTL